MNATVSPRLSRGSTYDAGLLVLGALGILSFLVGGGWDVSWHIVIGRDTFWSPPHLLLYAGINLVLAVLLGAYLLSRRWRDNGIAYRGPTMDFLGTPIAPGMVVMGLGAVMALTSAPIDNWWHAIFGLDVVIWSPPHLQLVFGVAFATLGLIATLVGEMNADDPGRLNRSPRPVDRRDLLLCFLGAELLITLNALYGEYAFDIPAFPVWMGAALTVVVVVGTLFAVSHASGRRWAATGMALFILVIDLVAQTVIAVSPALGQLIAPFVPAGYWPPATFVHYLGVFSLPAAVVLDLARSRLGERAAVCNIVLGGVPTTLTLIATVVLWNELWGGISWRQELPYWAYVVATLSGLLGAAMGVWLGRRLRPTANPLSAPEQRATGTVWRLGAAAAAVVAAVLVGRAVAAPSRGTELAPIRARLADPGVPPAEIVLGSDRLVAGEPLPVMVRFAPGAVGPGQAYDRLLLHYERAGVEASEPMAATDTPGEFAATITIPTPGRWSLVVLLQGGEPAARSAYDWRPLKFAADRESAAIISPSYVPAWNTQRISGGDIARWSGQMLIGKVSITLFMLLLAVAALRMLGTVTSHALARKASA